MLVAAAKSNHYSKDAVSSFSPRHWWRRRPHKFICHSVMIFQCDRWGTGSAQEQTHERHWLLSCVSLELQSKEKERNSWIIIIIDFALAIVVSLFITAYNVCDTNTVNLYNRHFPHNIDTWKFTVICGQFFSRQMAFSALYCRTVYNCIQIDMRFYLFVKITSNSFRVKKKKRYKIGYFYYYFSTLYFGKSTPKTLGMYIYIKS